MSTVNIRISGGDHEPAHARCHQKLSETRVIPESKGITQFGASGLQNYEKINGNKVS